MQRLSFAGTLVLAAIGICALSVPTSSQSRRVGRLDVETVFDRDAVAREVLVKLRDPLQLAQITSLVDPESLESLGRSGVLRIRSRSLSAAALLAALSRSAAVRYVEPNYVVRTFAEPNDPSFPQLWGLENTGQAVNGKPAGLAGADIRATAAWDSSFGSASHVVGVVDTGIDYRHPDLAPNVWSAPSAFTVTIGGVAVTCQAGTHGFNAIQRTCDPMDDHNHGTHVSGTIGAVGGNGIGVTGVNWVASIMGLKFLDADGTGTTGDAIAGIEFAIQAKQAFAATGGANIRILSNSWGGGEFSQALRDQIAAANSQDMLFVAAAGNSGFTNDVLPAYPASYAVANVIAVAATTNTDARASFSNYGANSVHLGAPGVDILSTTRNQAYGYSSGTSMAAPHVTGAAALVLSQCVLTTAQLKGVLMDTVDPVAGLAGKTITGGRLNVHSAVRSCSAPPDTPAGLTAAGGDRQVRLDWTAAAGAMSYRVKRSMTLGGPHTTVASNVKGLQYVDGGLVAGTPYYYVVSAANMLGESANSAEASATPTELPSDLVVYSFVVPTVVVLGSPLDVSVTTRNQGTGIANPSTTRFFVSANTVIDASDTEMPETQPVPLLAASASFASSVGLTVPLSLAPGSYYLLAKADADNVLLESNEGNNTRARSIAVGPDLSVASLTGPSGATPGGSIELSYTVENSGGAPAPISSLRLFWSTNSSLDASDTVLATATAGPVPPISSIAGKATITVPAGAPIGSFYVIAEADSTKVVPETRETNNRELLIVRIGGDLVVSGIDAPTAAGAGRSFVVTDATKNEGGSPVAASQTRIYLSTDSAFSAGDVLLGSRPIGALTPGELSTGPTTVAIPAGQSPGRYYLIAKADGASVVAESLETNNSASKSIVLGPDLTIYVNLVTSPVQAGAAAGVNDTTTNKGGAEAGPFNVGYYLSVNATFDATDIRLTPNREVVSLAAGASNTGSASVVIPAGTVPGLYYLIVKADADDTVGESSETNNTWPREFRVE